MKKFFPENFNAVFKGKVLSGFKPNKVGTSKTHLLISELLTAFLLFVFTISVTALHAGTKTWKSTVSGVGLDWTLGTNWVGDVAPIDGDDIVFGNPNAVISFSTMPATGVSYKSITIINGIIKMASGTPITITVGGNINSDFGAGAGIDLYINGNRGLELVSNITITLALNSTAIVNGIFTINSGCTYNCNSANAVTEVNGLLNDTGKGIISNKGTVTSASSSSFKFNSYSTYQHWQEGGQIPWATWHTTSTCNISLANNISPDPTRFAQEFGNLVWNCNPNLRPTNITFAPYLKTVKGKLIIEREGSSEYPLTNFILLCNAATGTLSIGDSLRIGGFTHIDGGIVNVGIGTTIKRGYQYAGALLTVNGGTLNTPYLTVGPHVLFSGESAYFNTTTGITILGGTVNIGGALTIHPTCVFRSTNTPAINIKGNLTNNGSYLKDRETATFNGTSPQIIQGTSVTTFYNLNINNAAGVSLQQDTRVWNTLTFTSGKITTGTKTLMLDVNATPVSGAGAGKYVFGNLGICIPANTNSVTFTIGDASAYTPVTLAFSGTPTNTIGNIIASTKTGTHPNIATTGIYGVDPAKILNRYFTLTNNGTTFGTCSATFSFINPTDLLGAADPLIFIVQRFAPNSWYPTTIGARTTTTTQVTGLLQTDFGDFQAGQMKCTAPVNTYTVTGGGSYCAGNTGAEVGLSNSQAGVVYQLRVNGVNTGSPVPGGGSSISFGNQATPGTYTVLATRVIGGCYSTMNNSVSIP